MSDQSREMKRKLVNRWKLAAPIHKIVFRWKRDISQYNWKKASKLQFIMRVGCLKKTHNVVDLQKIQWEFGNFHHITLKVDGKLKFQTKIKNS